MTVVQLKAQPAKTDALAALLAQRDVLEAQHQRLALADRSRADAEAALAALDAEQAQIDADERAAWAAWAQEPQSAPPAALSDRRAILAQKRALAAGDVASAINAAKVTAPRLAQINAELTRLGIKVLEIKAREALDEAAAKAVRVRELAHSMRSEWVSIIGLNAAATQARVEAAASDNRAVADIFAGIVSGIDALATPDLTWSGPEVAAATAHWRAALR